jgi:hypothetical protein
MPANFVQRNAALATGFASSFFHSVFKLWLHPGTHVRELAPVIYKRAKGFAEVLVPFGIEGGIFRELILGIRFLRSCG